MKIVRTLTHSIVGLLMKLMSHVICRRANFSSVMPAHSMGTEYTHIKLYIIFDQNLGIWHGFL